MWKWFLSLFKSKQETPIVVKPVEPIPEIPTQGDIAKFPNKSKIKKVAIIIGHGNGDSGAVSWDEKRNEFEYNSIVAHLVANSTLHGKEVRLFWRGKGGISGVAAEAVAWNPNLSIELHLNSYNGEAHGCEVLVLNGDSKSGTMARSFTSAFCSRFSRVVRRELGVNWISSGDRGAASLKGVSAIEQSILVEPFFIDNKNEWIEPISYANFLIDWLKSI